MKDTSKKQIIKVFLISILGLVIILGMLYFNYKTNIQQNKAQATEKRVLQYESTLKKELE
ncbi:antigen, partial [Bacillus cereus]